MNTSKVKKIVIIGGGFAGMNAAKVFGQKKKHSSHINR